MLASLQSLRNAQDHEIRETSKKVQVCAYPLGPIASVYLCCFTQTQALLLCLFFGRVFKNLEELVADTTRRLKQAESGARRDREALVQAQHQNHLIAAERDMVVKAIRDVQEVDLRCWRC